VRDGEQAVERLNELEYAQGFIWANVWYDNHLLKIDPTSGQVVAKLDLSPIARDLKLKDTESVLNGMAWDEQRQAMWITGKQWPKLFLLKIHQ